MLPLIVAILACVISVCAVGAVLYVVQIQKPTQDYVTQIKSLQLNMTGLNSPVVNRLDDKYIDHDGDMVADPPVKSSELIDPDTLAVSYLATEDPERYRDAFKEFCDNLAKVTGKHVRYELYKDADDELHALRNGKLHVAAFGTGTVPLAVDAAGFVPVSRLGGAGENGYRMLIIVPNDSPITTIDDLKGHELGLTEPTSNSGYKAALVLLLQNKGMKPEFDFHVRYSGGQETSISKIADKTYEAAAVASDVLDRQVANGAIKRDQYQVIYKSELFPTAALGYAYNLKPELAAKVKSALLNFPWAGTGLEKEFGGGGETKFIPVNYKDDWALVRHIDDAIGNKHVLK